MRRVALALLAVLAPTLATAKARNLSAFVENATLQAPVTRRGSDDLPDRQADAATAHVAHRVAPGPGTTLLLREYDAGGRMTADDESFRKVSMVLPSPLPESGELALDPASDLRVILGGSAWPRAACESKSVRSGTLAWTRRGNGTLDVRLEVEVELRPVAVTGFKECDRVETIRWSGRVPLLEASGLTGFQGGGVGDDGHVYRETHP